MMPACGSRPGSTSQNNSFDATPGPSGVGHVMSAATFFGAVAAGGVGFRTIGLRACADREVTRQSATAIARILSVYSVAHDFSRAWLTTLVVRTERRSKDLRY